MHAAKGAPQYRMPKMVDVKVERLGSLLVVARTEHVTKQATARATAILPAVMKV